MFGETLGVPSGHPRGTRVPPRILGVASPLGRVLLVYPRRQAEARRRGRARRREDKRSTRDMQTRRHRGIPSRNNKKYIVGRVLMRFSC